MTGRAAADKRSQTTYRKGSQPMRRPRRIEPTDPRAFAGLTRRQAARRAETLRIQTAIDTARSEGRHADAERMAADYHRRRADAREMAAHTATRDHAARVARLPIDERIGHAPTRA